MQQWQIILIALLQGFKMPTLYEKKNILEGFVHFRFEIFTKNNKQFLPEIEMKYILDPALFPKCWIKLCR